MEPVRRGRSKAEATGRKTHTDSHQDSADERAARKVGEGTPPGFSGPERWEGWEEATEASRPPVGELGYLRLRDLGHGRPPPSRIMLSTRTTLSTSPGSSGWHGERRQFR